MKVRTLKTILCAAVAFFGAACSSPASLTVLDGFAQGTTYHIVVEGCDDASLLKSQIDSILVDINSSMSLFDKSSRINALNANATDSLDSYIARCIEVAHKISVESDGNYDITIKPLVEARGFLASGAIENINVDSLLEFVGYNKIRIEDGRLIKDSPSVEIDLSSIAQGLSVDILGDYLASKGYANYLVELGGEIVCHGQRAEGTNWRVGIDRPVDNNNTPGAELQVRLSLASDRGLATSGNYRKFYLDNNGNRVVHTMSPITGESVISSLLSATVIAPDATLADAYGTLFMVLGLDASKAFLEAHPELDAYLVYGTDDGGIDVYATAGMQECILD